MPFRFDQLQQSLGGTGVRRLAMACNILLLGWIAWTVAQPFLGWQRQDTDTQTAALPETQIAGIPETGERERYDITSWHLFGVPSAKPADIAPEKLNAPETRLNLELNGVYLDDQPGNSRAIISEKGKQQEHYQVGDQLPGNAVLDEIHAGHVLLERNGRYERLALTEKFNTGSNGLIMGSSPASRQSSSRTQQPSTGLPGKDQSSPNLLRLRPLVRDGVFQGMAISAGSAEGRHLLEKANVKILNSDVVTTINGIEIHDAEAGMALLEDYTEPERLELIIRRGDETIPVIIDPDAGN